MKREELLRSRQYWITNIQDDLYGIIDDYMKKNNLNRTALAKQLGVSKGYVTQVLSGEFDHKISKLVDLALAVGEAPTITFTPIEKVIEKDNNPETHNKHLKKIEYTFVVKTATGEDEITNMKREQFYNTKALYCRDEYEPIVSDVLNDVYADYKLTLNR